MESEAAKPPTLPDFHDGHLTGIIVGDGSADLLCSTVHGDKYTWHLFGVQRLRADNFRQGNIIFEIILHQKDFPSNLVKTAFGYDREDEPAWLAAEILKLRDERGMVLEVGSSYGCHVVVVFYGGFTIEPYNRNADDSTGGLC